MITKQEALAILEDGQCEHSSQGMEGICTEHCRKIAALLRDQNVCDHILTIVNEVPSQSSSPSYAKCIKCGYEP